MKCGFLLACLASVIAGVGSATAAEAPRLPSLQVREDLIHLRDVWASQDRSMGEDQRRGFEEVITEALARSDKYTMPEFALEVSRAVALSRNGHSGSSLGNSFHGLPIQMSWFKDGPFIVQARPDSAQLLGARVEKIGNLSAEQALAKVTPYISGSNEFIRNWSPAYLRLVEVLHQLGAATSEKEVALTIHGRDGKSRKINLRPLPA